MADVFIAYKREERPYAQALEKVLDDRGISVWADWYLTSGVYANVTRQEINKAKAVIVLWSRQAADSDIIFSEADLARKQNKLVGARLTECELLPAGFDVHHIHDLTHWNCKPNHESLPPLLRAVEEKVKGEISPDIEKARYTPSQIRILFDAMCRNTRLLAIMMVVMFFSLAAFIYYLLAQPHLPGLPLANGQNGLQAGVHQAQLLESLAILGYAVDPARSTAEETQRTLRLFQGEYGLQVTGDMDGATQQNITTALQDHYKTSWSGARLTNEFNHDGIVNAVAVSSDGQRVASASADRTAAIWSTDSGRELYRLRHDTLVRDVSFSHDGHKLLTGGANYMARIWDISTESVIQDFRSDGKILEETQYAPSGKLFVTVSRDIQANTHGWALYRTGTAPPLIHETSNARHAAFSSDGRTLAVGMADGSIQIWDVDGGELTRSIDAHDGALNAVAFSPDGELLISASDDGTAQIRRLEGAGTDPVVLQGHNGRIFSASYSHDGRLVVTAGEDATVRLWDSSTGKQITIVGQHGGRVSEAVFLPDDKHIVSACWDGRVRVWSAAPPIGTS